MSGVMSPLSLDAFLGWTGTAFTFATGRSFSSSGSISVFYGYEAWSAALGKIVDRV
jgi:hypothetical protein